MYVSSEGFGELVHMCTHLSLHIWTMQEVPESHVLAQISILIRMKEKQSNLPFDLNHRYCEISALLSESQVLYDFLGTVKVAPHECIIRTGQH